MDEEAVEALPFKDREGRYGSLFGSAVHYVIGLMLRSNGMTARDAVQRAAKLYGLTEHLDETVADVERALEALRAAGRVRPSITDFQLEYPVAGRWTDGQLASGYIDFVAVENDRVDIIDFKTDTPLPGLVEQTYPKYAAQVRIYGKLLETAGVLKDRDLRCGLLFTADGSRNSTVSVVEHDRRHQTRVKILDETIEIELREGLNRREKQFTAAELREREKFSWLRDRKEYEFYPSGNFVFTILEYCGQGVRKVWSDGKRQRLENCLNSIIAGLHKAAEGVKAHRLELERLGARAPRGTTQTIRGRRTEA